MGYPMTFSRLIGRNGLLNYREGYAHGTDHFDGFRGDLARFVENTQDHHHVEWFARITGATEDQIRRLLAIVFDDQDKITFVGMPVGGAPFTNEIARGEPFFPTGVSLTERADQTKIAELEKQVSALSDEVMDLAGRWIDEKNRADNRTWELAAMRKELPESEMEAFEQQRMLLYQDVVAAARDYIEPYKDPDRTKRWRLDNAIGALHSHEFSRFRETGQPA